MYGLYAQSGNASAASLSHGLQSSVDANPSIVRGVENPARANKKALENMKKIVMIVVV